MLLMNPKKYPLELVAHVAASIVKGGASAEVMEPAVQLAIKLLDTCAKELGLNDKPKRKRKKERD
jgi:hypothetical protein